MAYKFKLDHNPTEAIKNICCVKSEDKIDHTTRWFKKFCSGCKKLDDQLWSDWPKTMDSKAVFRAG